MSGQGGAPAGSLRGFAYFRYFTSGCLPAVPLIFKESAIALLNKVDLVPFCNFDLKSAEEDIDTLHPGMKVIEVSCTKDQGVDAWCDWLLLRVRAKQGK